MQKLRVSVYESTIISVSRYLQYCITGIYSIYAKAKEVCLNITMLHMSFVTRLCLRNSLVSHWPDVGELHLSTTSSFRFDTRTSWLTVPCSSWSRRCARWRQQLHVWRLGLFKFCYARQILLHTSILILLLLCTVHTRMN